MNNTVYLYVFNTMSDWEIGYLTAELNTGRYFKKGLSPLKIVTVGLERTPITTMGGLTIMPDLTLNECHFDRTDALILPGGETWLEAIHQPVLKAVETCFEKGTLVAAICGATMGLAQAGLLNTRKHTSNDLGYMKMVCPAYSGEHYYNYSPAVMDEKLVTASGIAPLEFTVQVLKALDVFSSETLEAWYQLNKTHEPQYFYTLMCSVQ